MHLELVSVSFRAKLLAIKFMDFAKLETNHIAPKMNLNLNDFFLNLVYFDSSPLTTFIIVLLLIEGLLPFGGNLSFSKLELLYTSENVAHRFHKEKIFDSFSMRTFSL